MMKVSPISADTCMAMAKELSGIEIDGAKAEIHASLLADIQKQIAELRKLPIKDIAPPLFFKPEEDLL
jgi:hypothetical protein